MALHFSTLFGGLLYIMDDINWITMNNLQYPLNIVRHGDSFHCHAYKRVSFAAPIGVACGCGLPRIDGIGSYPQDIPGQLCGALAPTSTSEGQSSKQSVSLKSVYYIFQFLIIVDGSRSFSSFILPFPELAAMSALTWGGLWTLHWTPLVCCHYYDITTCRTNEGQPIFWIYEVWPETTTHKSEMKLLGLIFCP